MPVARAGVEAANTCCAAWNSIQYGDANLAWDSTTIMSIRFRRSQKCCDFSWVSRGDKRVGLRQLETASTHGELIRWSEFNMAKSLRNYDAITYAPRRPPHTP